MYCDYHLFWLKSDVDVVWSQNGNNCNFEFTAGPTCWHNFRQDFTLILDLASPVVCRGTNESEPVCQEKIRLENEELDAGGVSWLLASGRGTVLHHIMLLKTRENSGYVDTLGNFIKKCASHCRNGADFKNLPCYPSLAVTLT